MQEELEEIVIKMNEFSKKYECKLELETYEKMYVNSDVYECIYKLKAIKPRKIIART